MDKFDLEKDGSIDYVEFIEEMNPKSGQKIEVCW